VQQAVVLTEADLRRLVGFRPTSLAAVEAAFVALSRGGAAMPPIMHLHLPDPPGGSGALAVRETGHSAAQISVSR